MATAKFNSDLDGFISEMRLDAAAGEVDRLILRLTQRWERMNAPFVGLKVVASYATGGEPVVLEHQCGTFMTGTAEQDEVKKIADERWKQIEAAAAECKLQVRGGVFE